MINDYSKRSLKTNITTACTDSNWIHTADRSVHLILIRIPRVLTFTATFLKQVTVQSTDVLKRVHSNPTRVIMIVIKAMGC